jgi:molybdopterin/thiamine biosynthesis adenylyltransferase
MEVRGGSLLGEALSQILASTQEELVIGFGYPASRPEWAVVVKEVRLATDDEVTRDHHGLHWSGDLTSRFYASAAERGCGIVMIHAHPGSGRAPRPSNTDRDTAATTLDHFATLLPDALHVYAVINDDGVAGWAQTGNERRSVDLVRAVQVPVRKWRQTVPPTPPTRERDTRQVAALSEAGIAALRTSRIGIVGAGGAGSQVAEMLAHAAAGNLVIVDGDKVEQPNLSRTHGTTPRMVGRFKARVIRQFAVRIDPSIAVAAICEPFPSKRSIAALRDVDVVVSCVDNPFARNELNRFCLRYAIPIVDVGTTITPDPLSIDGHITRCLPPHGCLRCAGHVSDAILEAWISEERNGKYGVDEHRPQVVSFNGLLASAAVTEVLKIVTGFARDGNRSSEWHYDAMSGELRSIRLPTSNCSDCEWFAMKGDTA